MPRGDDDERAAVCAPRRRRRLPRVALEARALPDLLDLAPDETVLERARSSAESLRASNANPPLELLALLALAGREQREEAPCVRLLADACVGSLLGHRSLTSLWVPAQVSLLLPPYVPGVVFSPGPSMARACQHLLGDNATRTRCGHKLDENWLRVAIDDSPDQYLATTRCCKLCARASDEGDSPYSFPLQWLADARRRWELSAAEQEHLRASLRATLLQALGDDAVAMPRGDRLQAIASALLSRYFSVIAARLEARVDPKLWQEAVINPYPELRDLLEDVYGSSPPLVRSTGIAQHLRLSEKQWLGSPAEKLAALFLSTWPEAVPQLRRRAADVTSFSIFFTIGLYLTGD